MIKRIAKFVSINSAAAALGLGLLAYTLMAPAANAQRQGNSGALYQQVGGGFYVCICQADNQNCFPCT